MSCRKIEGVEKEGRRREKKQWLHSVFKLATLSEKKANNGGRKRSVLPWQYAFLEIQLHIYTHKSITTTTKFKVYNTLCPANSYNANLGRTRL